MLHIICEQCWNTDETKGSLENWNLWNRTMLHTTHYAPYTLLLNNDEMMKLVHNTNSPLHTIRKQQWNTDKICMKHKQCVDCIYESITHNLQTTMKHRWNNKTGVEHEFCVEHDHSVLQKAFSLRILHSVSSDGKNTKKICLL